MADTSWLSQTISEGDIAEEGFEDTPTYAAERLYGEPLAPTPLSITTEPEWGFDVGERVAKSAQESFGAIWSGLGAMADSVGMDGARDWAINRSNELFEEASSHDIITTQFAEISNPIDLAKFTSE